MNLTSEIIDREYQETCYKLSKRTNVILQYRVSTSENKLSKEPIIEELRQKCQELFPNEEIHEFAYDESGKFLSNKENWNKFTAYTLSGQNNFVMTFDHYSLGHDELLVCLWRRDFLRQPGNRLWFLCSGESHDTYEDNLKFRSEKFADGIIQEARAARQKRGILQAKKEKKYKGRKPGSKNIKQLDHEVMQEKFIASGYNGREAAKQCHIKPKTLYHHIGEWIKSLRQKGLYFKRKKSPSHQSNACRGL